MFFVIILLTLVKTKSIAKNFHLIKEQMKHPCLKVKKKKKKSCCLTILLMTKEINGPVPNSIQDESLIKYSFRVLIFTKNVIGHYSAYPY